MADQKNEGLIIAIIAIVLILVFVGHNLLVPAKIAPTTYVPQGSQAAYNAYTIGGRPGYNTANQSGISGNYNSINAPANQYSAQIAGYQYGAQTQQTNAATNAATNIALISALGGLGSSFIDAYSGGGDSGN